MGEKVWRFAGLTYSARAGLLNGDKQIALGPQARQLLELLIEANGRMISREEIAARLWPDRAASDDSIDRAVYLLRKPLRAALGGDLIATSYGRGLTLRAAIEVFVTPDETAHAQTKTEPRLLQLWQTAYELSGSRTRVGFARAQEAIAAAINLDPTAAEAWSLAADIAAGRAMRGFVRPAEAAALIECAAERACAVAPGHLSSLAVLGWARGILENRLSEGLTLLDEVVAKDPAHVKARSYRPWLLAASDRLDEALKDAEIGTVHAPMDINCMSVRAWLTLCAGDIGRAAELTEEYLDRRPDSAALLVIRAGIQIARGQSGAAVENCRRAVESGPDDPFLLSALACALASAGRVDEAEPIVNALASGTPIYAPPCALAAPVLALGRREEALALLARARAEGCPWFAFAHVDFRLRPLRAEIERLRAEPLPEFSPPPIEIAASWDKSRSQSN